MFNGIQALVHWIRRKTYLFAIPQRKRLQYKVQIQFSAILYWCWWSQKRLLYLLCIRKKECTFTILLHSLGQLNHKRHHCSRSGNKYHPDFQFLSLAQLFYSLYSCRKRYNIFLTSSYTVLEIGRYNTTLSFNYCLNSLDLRRNFPICYPVAAKEWKIAHIPDFLLKM